MSYKLMKEASRFIRRSTDKFIVQTPFEGESRTVQDHKNVVDINTIVKKFDRTGQLPTGRMDGQYGDVTQLQSDLTTLIAHSRNIRDEAREKLLQRQLTARQKALEQAKKDAEELAAFRAAEAKRKAQESP